MVAVGSLAAVLPASAGTTRAELRPDELALIVNSNEPAGMELAQFYARQRVVPDNRILVLDLPKGDDITPKQYAEQVVPQVREFLHSGGLEQKVKCLVPFYGVPLRIAARQNTPAEVTEMNRLRAELARVPDDYRTPVEAVEGLGRRLDPTFTPDTGLTLAALDKRWSTAVQVVSAQLPTIPNPKQRDDLKRQFFVAAEPLLGKFADITVEQMDLAAHPERAAADRPAVEAAARDYQQAKADALAAEDTPEDFPARAKLRVIAKGNFGLTQYARLIRDQIDYLDERHGSAAFDSELALVQWRVHGHTYVNGGGSAAHVQSFINPLFYRDALGPRPSPTPTMMVTRLDGPTPDLVKAMIATSIRVEEQGLKGKIVIDARGVIPGQEPANQKGLGPYDQSLRDFHEIVANRPGLDVVFDNAEALLPAHSQTDVAVYCGWYHVDSYVPCCSFAGGAVAMHVASYTMTTLRSSANPNWAVGLLTDGAVATIGPVAEPYLFAFPRADDFFPLLLTGKLTLAECYWRTEPVASWQMACVGDPLYTPYRAHPALTEADLPLRLHGVFHPATPPAVAKPPAGAPAQAP